MKLLITDLDGTLLDENHEIGEEALLILREFEELGYGVSFATGRSVLAALPHIERAKIRYPVILFNGAMIFDPVTRTPLMTHTMDRHAVEKIINDIPKNVSLLIFTEDAVYAFNPVEALEGYLERDGIACEFVNDFQLDRTAVLKILLVGSRDRLDELYSVVVEKWGNIASVVRSETDLIELLPKGVNKGEGLKELCAHLGIALSDVVAVGDSLNDVEVLQRAGLGVAVGNAREEVKRRADVVLEGKGYRGLRELLQILKEVVLKRPNTVQHTPNKFGTGSS